MGKYLLDSRKSQPVQHGFILVMPMDCGSHDARVSYASEEKSWVACILYISG